jgi:hypothetical protein
MSVRSLVLACALLGAAVAGVAADPPAALAARKAYENKKLGFRLRIDDRFVQNPPQLTPETAFLVGDWYEDSAKFDRNLRPTFQVMWFAEPKEGKGPPPPPPGPPEAASDDGAPKSRADEIRDMREAMRVRDLDDAMGRFFQQAVPYFGPAKPMAERWASAEKDKTGGKIPIEFFEVNPPPKKKPKDTDPRFAAYAYAARLTLDRPDEVIHVGFLGYCSVEFRKDMRDDFAAVVRSFEELKTATDSRNEGAQAGLSMDKEERYQQILKNKLAPGWKAARTENYIFIHHDEVDPKLVRKIESQIEALRAQVYEVLFPPDKPITAFSIVRVCKDPEQYHQYGGPPGSAGYWNFMAEELVFYEGKPIEDSLRVLYHEAFHQFIFYSVGDFAPHSWFNEGTGDYFAGHDYRAGKFVRGPFAWRISTAKTWKPNPKRPPLRDWLKWTQAQYYGRNDAQVPPGVNYALGWSFIYYLRTTKKPEYQGILDRYFQSLKGAISRERASEEAFRKKLEDWEKQKAEKPDLPKPERNKDYVSADPLKGALDEAFRGIDIDQLERDWLAADY